MAPSTTTDATALRVLLASWEKGLRTLSIYLPNNPVRQLTIDALQEGLSGLWKQLPEFTLTVSEAGLEWKSEIVLPVENKSESLAWTLFRDGIRWMVFSPGAEGEEIVTFLTLIQRARTLTDEDEEDLRTLLWSADLRVTMTSSISVNPASFRLFGVFMVTPQSWPGRRPGRDPDPKRKPSLLCSRCKCNQEANPPPCTRG